MYTHIKSTHKCFVFSFVTGGSAAATAGSGQPASASQQQQPVRKLDSSFDIGALKTGAVGAGSRRGLVDYGASPDTIVGHLLVVRAECLPRSLAGPAPAPPSAAAPITHNTSLATVLNKPNSPVEHIQEVGWLMIIIVDPLFVNTPRSFLPFFLVFYILPLFYDIFNIHVGARGSSWVPTGCHGRGQSIGRRVSRSFRGHESTIIV